MASASDLSRARRLCQRTLAEEDGLGQRQAACGNAELRATLAGIGRRKAGQTRRLLAWMAHQGQPAPVVDTSGPAGTEATDESTDPSEAPVTERRDVSPDLVVFRVAKPEGFSFAPGQSVKVTLGGIRRTYSIVSAPHEPFLEFFVELAPGGQMSGQIRQLRVGDRLSLGKPGGGLTFDDNVRHHLMIATVAGINPFVSMVRDYLHRARSGHHLVLMHGASYQDEFGYRDEMEALAAAHPDQLTYLPTVSRPEEERNRSWTGQTGRVDTRVSDVLAQPEMPPGDTLVYACGHSGMLASVDEQVRRLGYRLETESYD